MYLVGADDGQRERAESLVRGLLARRERLVTDAEVFQEILHRYSSIGRIEAIQPAFDALLRLVDEVLPIELETIIEAKAILFGYPTLSARDALHASAMKKRRITSLLSFERGYDVLPFISRNG